MNVTRVGLRHLADLGISVQLPGVSWDRYDFPLDGDEDARLEAEAIFAKSRKAEWVVITDSTGHSWIFRRGERQTPIGV